MEEPEYDLFDLKVSGSRATGFFVDLLQSEVGELKRVPFELPFDEKDLEIFVLRMGKSATGQRAAPAVAERQKEIAREFGNDLFRALFESSDLEQLLKRSMDRADASGRGLMLRLRLGDGEGLSNIPWEYLHGDPDDGFLALSTAMPVVRYLEVTGVKNPVAVEPPLRILVVISSPADGGYATLQTDEEWARLQRATESLRASGRLELVRLEHATLEAMTSRLDAGDIHALHFIGHGDYNPNSDEGVLIFEYDDRSTRAVPGNELTVAVRDADLRLVVLNSCKGARTALNDPFSGVAQQLIRSGVPAVVAMQFEISDTAAIEFADYFYRALNDGDSVDRAVSKARKGLFTAGNFVEWGTPVTYTRTSDTRLLEPIAGSAGAATDSPLDADAAVAGAAALGIAQSTADVEAVEPLGQGERDIASVVTRALALEGFDLAVDTDDVVITVTGDIGSTEDADRVDTIVNSSLIGLGQGRIVNLNLSPTSAPPAHATGGGGAAPEQTESDRSKWLVPALIAAAVLIGLAFLVFSGLGSGGDPVVAEPTAVPPTEVPQPEPDPTAAPTVEPTAVPTTEPTVAPTAVPSATPTVEPTATPAPDPAVVAQATIQQQLDDAGVTGVEVTIEDGAVVVSGGADGPAEARRAIEIVRSTQDETGAAISVSLDVAVDGVGSIVVSSSDTPPTATADVLLETGGDEDLARQVARDLAGELAGGEIDDGDVVVRSADEVVRGALAPVELITDAFGDEEVVTIDADGIRVSGICSDRVTTTEDATTAITDAFAGLGRSAPVDVSFFICDQELAATGTSTDLLAVAGLASVAAGALMVHHARGFRRNFERVGSRPSPTNRRRRWQ